MKAVLFILILFCCPACKALQALNYAETDSVKVLSDTTFIKLVSHDSGLIDTSRFRYLHTEVQTRRPYAVKGVLINTIAVLIITTLALIFIKK